MKQFLFILFILPTLCFSQGNKSGLDFSTAFYDCVDKWVALPTDETKHYSFGFVYFDLQAGLTFQWGGFFDTDENGKAINIEKDSTSSVKIRIERGMLQETAILPQEKLDALGLKDPPKWLIHYKKYDEELPENLVQTGYHYNHVGASKQALVFLEKAKEINPKTENLTFELCYAYNELGQFSKSIVYLHDELKEDSKNPLLYREIGYAYVFSEQADIAEKYYKKGLKLTDDNFMKSEMGIMMAQGFLAEGNFKKYNKWAAITRKYATKNSPFLEMLDLIDTDIKQ